MADTANVSAMSRPLLTLLLAATFFLSGCGRDQPATATAPAAAVAPVRVLAAASTADAVRAAAKLFTKKTGVEVDISAAGSNTLAAQILAGAPADIFLSASQEWADAVRDAGLAAEVTPLLTNELSLVVPLGKGAKTQKPRDLLGEHIRHVAVAAEGVPAGRYAEQSLRAEGVWDALVAADKIVRGGDVRQAMAYVENGEADAAIVYASDGFDSEKAATVYDFAADSHDPIVYPLVLMKAKGGEPTKNARDFAAFLKTKAATKFFRNRAFGVIADGES